MDIVQFSKLNNSYRKVVITEKNIQIISQCLIDITENVPKEVHMDTSQIIIGVSGKGYIEKNDKIVDIKEGFITVVNPGQSHAIFGKEFPFKFYTIYDNVLHDPFEVTERQKKMFKIKMKTGDSFILKKDNRDHHWGYFSKNMTRSCSHVFEMAVEEAKNINTENENPCSKCNEK